MKKSESINELAAALAAAQAEYKAVPKKKTAKVRTRQGGEFSYKYADLADVLEMALPVLGKHGLALTQFIRQSEESPSYLRDRDGDRFEIHAPCWLYSVLLHSSGQWIESDGVLITQQADKQAFGSELSYARRYDGCSILGIMPDEDDDGKVATESVRADKAAKPAAAKPKGEVIPPAAEAHPAADAILSIEDRRQFFQDCYGLGGNNDTIQQAVKTITGHDSTKLVKYRDVEKIKAEVYKMANPGSGIPADVAKSFAEEIVP